jgi:hypothetical protein
MSLIQDEQATTEVRLPAASTTAARTTALGTALFRAFREFALVALLFMGYKAGRVVAAGHVGAALTNADDVWRFERLLHLPSEYALQQVVIRHEWLIEAANRYYAYVHFPITAACLVWLYIWRPAHYVRTRRMLAWLTAAALLVHLVMPLAPPRMLTAVGMLDTGKMFGPAVYGSPTADTLTNQYAAMPSLHFGWAVAVAIALITATRSRWRWLWLAHSVITLLVIVVTGNHYWLDAMVAGALLAVVLSVQAGWRPFSFSFRAVARAAIPKPRTGES